MVAADESRWVVYEVGATFGWEREEAVKRWAAALTGAPDEPIPGDRFLRAVQELAHGAARDPVEAVAAVRKCLAERAAEYDGPIAEKEAEADALASELRSARERAAAVAAYGDEKAVETAIRLEGHLTRQLGQALDLLDRLRGDRSGGDRAELTGLFRGPAGGAPLVVSANGLVS